MVAGKGRDAGGAAAVHRVGAEGATHHAATLAAAPHAAIVHVHLFQVVARRRGEEECCLGQNAAQHVEEHGELLLVHAFNVAHAVCLVSAERHDDEVGLRGGDALPVTLGEEAFAGGAVAAYGGEDEAVGVVVGHHLRLAERCAQRLLHGIGKRLARHVRVAEMQHAQRPFATQHDVECGAQGGGICHNVLLAVSERRRHAARRFKRKTA